MASDLFGLEVSLQGFDETISKYTNSAEKVKQATYKMLDQASLIAWGKAKELAPEDKNTLRGSITRRVSETEARVGTNVSYAKYQELGTGIYGPKGQMIVPKVARFLKWTGKDGITHYARAVRGVRPVKYLQGGLEEMKSKIKLILNVGISVLKATL